MTQPQVANPMPALALPKPSPRPSRWRRLRRRVDAVFLIAVLLPVAIAATYYGAVASDVYISESRFVVRSPQRSAPTGLGALLQGTGLARAQDDTYSVHDYALSRDALRELDEKLKLRAAFSDPAVDFVNRFPGVEADESFEALHRYYLKHVSIDYDTTSSISVLRTRAYTAEQARGINEMLLQMGERLVNSLNSRSRRDLVEVAQQEVKVAEERTRAAAVSLSSFRADRGVFDPDRQSAMQLQSAAKLQEELFTAETQLAQLRQLSPRNPQVAGLASRVEALRRQAASETGKVTGRGNSLTAKSPDFDRLVLEKGFADRQLAAALASLESARSEAARKQLYLERLVQPNLPDKAVEPRRLRSVAVVLLLGLVCWGVIILVVASIREHTD